MNFNGLVLRVVQALERLRIPDMIVGSYSGNAYGNARSTQDADFVIELADPSALFQALAPLHVARREVYRDRFIQLTEHRAGANL